MYIAATRFPTPITIASLEEIENKYLSALDWISRLGLSYHNTRLDKYKKNFNSLANAIRSQNEVTISHDDLFNTYKEIMDIIHIHEGLSKSINAGITHRIHKLLKGHELITKEKWKKGGRQTAFELILASSLIKKGVDVDVSTKADIKFVTDNTTVFIECKHLVSQSNIKENIKKAFSQLEDNYKKVEPGMTTYGIVALCIDYIYNPQFGILVNDTNSERFHELTKAGHLFFSSNDKYIRLNKDDKTVGIVASMTIPYWEEQNMKLGTIGLDTVFSYDQPGTSRYYKLSKIANALVDGYNTDTDGKLIATDTA